MRAATCANVPASYQGVTCLPLDPGTSDDIYLLIVQPPGTLHALRAPGRAAPRYLQTSTGAGITLRSTTAEKHSSPAMPSLLRTAGMVDEGSVVEKQQRRRSLKSSLKDTPRRQK